MTKPKRSKAVLPPMPIGLIRSALFGVGSPPRSPNEELDDGDAEQRLPIKCCHVYASKAFGVQLVYTGPQLTQQHSLLWQAVLAAASKRGLIGSDERLVVTPGELERSLGRKHNTKTQHRIWRDLNDLVRAHLELQTTRHRFSGALLLSVEQDKEANKFAIQLNHRLAGLLADEVLKNDLDRKVSMGRDGLALWLHDYIGSQLLMPPTSFVELHRLTGDTSPPKYFRAKLKSALTKLSVGTRPLVVDWKFDDQDRLIVKKIATNVLLLPSPAAAKKAAGRNAQTEHERKVHSARSQRAKVAL